MERGKSI